MAKTRVKTEALIWRGALLGQALIGSGSGSQSEGSEVLVSNKFGGNCSKSSSGTDTWWHEDTQVGESNQVLVRNNRQDNSDTATVHALCA